MPPKVIHVGLLNAVQTLDPHGTVDTQSTLAAAQIYESPCAVPMGNGPAQPVLFRSLEQTSPSTWTAVMRPGVTFSDGTPLTAAVAAAALGRSQFIQQQASIETRDDRLVFSLRAPNPRFDQALTRHQCAITLAKDQTLLGTGAFVPVRGSRADLLRLVRNERYRRPVAIDEIVFRVYPPDPTGKPTALLEALSRGEVDFTSTLSRADATGIPKVRVKGSLATSTAMLFFNTERPSLANTAMRAALSLAVDRMAVTELSFSNPVAHVANGLLPPMLGSLRDDLIHDVAKAKEWLGRAGGAIPSPLRLVGVWPPRPYLPNPKAAAELIAKQLGLLNLKVQVYIPSTGNEMQNIKYSGDYDLLLTGWFADMPDPVDFLEALLGSDRIPVTTSTGLPCANSSRLRSSKLDAALTSLRSNRASSDYAAVQKILAEQVALVPIMYGSVTIVTSWRLKDLEVTPLSIPLFGAASLAD